MNFGVYSESKLFTGMSCDLVEDRNEDRNVKGSFFKVLIQIMYSQCPYSQCPKGLNGGTSDISRPYQYFSLIIIFFRPNSLITSNTHSTIR